jgi:hypothetical protein
MASTCRTLPEAARPADRRPHTSMLIAPYQVNRATQFLPSKTTNLHHHAPGSPNEPTAGAGQDCRKASRSASIVSAWVVGMPCGNPWYVFSVPFCTSFADSGPESA